MPFQIPGTSITLSRRRNQARHSPSPSDVLETQAPGQPILTSSSYQLHDNGGTGQRTPLPTLNARHLETSPSPSTTAGPNPEGSTSTQALSLKLTRCGSCGKPMGGQFVRALGTAYHLSCFNCMDCGISVASKFFPIDGPEGKQHPLCELDYFRRLNYLCARCGQGLKGSYITACNKKYHVEHFACSVCPTCFGPQDTYFEHDGDVYCHYHYSTRCAGRCTGCNHAILKKFVETKGKNEVWHPDCYMVYKFWNVKMASKLLNTSSTDERPQNPSYLEEEGKETAISLKEKQDKMEETVARIWTVLSTFEESCAAVLSDMLKQVSNDQYLKVIRLAEKLLLHIEVLFAVIDDLDFRFISLGLRGISHVREARMLCRNLVDLLTLFAHHQRTPDQQTNNTQELLTLVTGSAHRFKTLINIALIGALKLEREQNVQGGVDLLLDRLHMLAEQGCDPVARRAIAFHSDSTLSNINRSTQGVAYGFRSLAPEAAGESPFMPSALRDNQLSSQKPPSDSCARCRQTLEEDCVRLGTHHRWHSSCIQCAVCGKTALPLASEGQSLAGGLGQGTEKVLNQSKKPSTIRRPPANTELFVYDPETTVEMPFGEAPTIIYCTKHGHPKCRGGFEPVQRLEQYAFLLNVALWRLYLLLKKRGVISSSPESNLGQDPDSLELMSNPPSPGARVFVPTLSTIIESQARKITRIPDFPPALDKSPQLPQLDTTQHTSCENRSNIKDSPGRRIQQGESDQGVGEPAPLENQSPAQSTTTAYTPPPTAVSNLPSIESSALRPAQPSVMKPLAPAPIRPLPQRPPKPQPASSPAVQGASPAPAVPLASPPSVHIQTPLPRGAYVDPTNLLAASVPSIQVSECPPLDTDTAVPESGSSPRSTSTASTQDDSKTNTGSSFFNQAHNFSVLNPNMYDIGAQHNYYLGFTNVLDCLAKYTMTGVEYNSSIREHSPRCHPGTRAEIIQDIQAGFRDPSWKAKMIWMCGPAGVGKSTIMQTLAETQSQDTLGAALFISKAGKRNDSRQVFPTVAYQLAVRNPSYQAYIGGRLKADPKFLDKSLTEQFESLITIPFTAGHIALGTDRFIILIDGLDECQNERDQCKIIDLIHNFVAHRPTSPLTWIIASRPELHLQTAFSRAKDNLEAYQEHRIFIHSGQASRDVESYLRDEFTRIQQSNPDSISSASPWPNNRQLLKIAHASSGLFLFASSVLGFIDSGDPVSRLHRTLAFLDGLGSKTPSPNENPFQMLDMLYTQIMSEVPANMLPVTKALFGYYLPRRNAFPARSEGPFLLACNLLGIERHIAYGALRTFYSVLTFPSSVNAHQEQLQFLHNSFADYLRSPTRSKIYSVDLDHAMTEQWRCYARVLLEWHDGYSHECIKLSWVPDREDQHSAAYELRENMFDQASSSWTVMLYRHCHSWCPASCIMKAPGSTCLVLSLSEVSNFLRRVDFGVPIPFGKDPVDMLDFLTWVRDHTPMELRREIVMQEFPLNKLKRPRFFQALCEKKWYRGVKKRYGRFETEIDGQGVEQIGYLDTSEWETAEEILQGDVGGVGDLVRLVLESHDATEVMVTVLGADPAKCCGIIRYQKSPTEVQYHIFPYGEIYLQGSPRLTMISLD